MSNDPDVIAGIRALQAALGDDLAKQVYADASAADRQTKRDHFEARMEYARQIAERNQATENSIKEYGLQTLKWLFLLNAGAIALVLTYVGGKSADTKIPIGQIAIATAPFMAGCVFVVVAGAFAFFNMSHGFGYLPSAESLHQFLNPTYGKWPLSRQQEQAEDGITFHKRFAKKLGRSRNIAMGFAWSSALLFCLGAILVLRVVMTAR